MIFAVLAAGAFLYQAAPAAAPPASTAPATSTKDVTSVVVTGKRPSTDIGDGKEVICHNETVIGTLFPKKICARREEILGRKREDQAELRRNTALRPWKDPAS
jgi:hypothetical protein